MVAANTAVLHDWHHADYSEASREIWDAIGDISDVEVFGPQVLTACYVRPIKTRGGIITIAKTQREDVYQGLVSMILKLGPDAFHDADPALYGGRKPMVGDWVYSRVQDAFNLSLRGPGGSISAGRQDSEGREWAGWPCRLIFAADIYGRVKLPHVIV